MPTDARLNTDSVARLKARPGVPVRRGVAGLQHLRLRRRREALLYIPEGAIGEPAALAVMLHGAGGNAEQGLGLIKDCADERQLIVLAPESRKNSWDIISDSHYGPDVSFIDDALHETFSLYVVDGERIALGGFSDGASYALSLGLSNASLFQYVLAFSPGFMAPARVEGRPRVYISHGTRDDVLPIDRCSRKLVGFLQQHNLPVRYREFEGPHTVPPEVRQDAIDWFLDR
jgi:phospholipase/carboxylesterase